MAATTLRLSNTYLGAPVAIKAMAAKLARLVYRMLRYGMKYVDRGAALYCTKLNIARDRSATSYGKHANWDSDWSRLRQPEAGVSRSHNHTAGLARASQKASFWEEPTNCACSLAASDWMYN